MSAASLASPAAARTRLLLEGPIVATLLRLTPANLVVNVVLITGIATPSADDEQRLADRLQRAGAAGVAAKKRAANNSRSTTE